MNDAYGGLWTRKKLEILRDYLAFYVQALKNQPFTLHYADAFAGTGAHIPPMGDESQLELVSRDALEGSVRAALGIEPGFHRYHFNDNKPEHVERLRDLAAMEEHQGKQVDITQQDANDFVRDFCRSLKGMDRAVLFVDPYSAQLDWSSLEIVAASGKVDLWLLFPISALSRMTPMKGIRDEWREPLNRLLGTGAWEAAFYEVAESSSTPDLFSDAGPAGAERQERQEFAKLEAWVTSRLRELFPYVAEPIPLMSHNRPLFDLYFAVSNQSSQAIRLAKRVVGDILKKRRSS